MQQVVTAICVKAGYVIENAAASQPILMARQAGETPRAMDLTREQLTFLADLRKGTCPATAAQDASIIGPLIRANLVRWEDDPSEAAGRRKPPGSSFTLTTLGEACLAEHEAKERLPE